MFTQNQITLAETILAQARQRGVKIATAESCTGGLVSACLTAIAGSSDVFERGFVTYSNEAKSDMLGVDPLLIAQHGAVSLEVAEAMARGALMKAPAQLAVSITGIAGPGGGSSHKPVGTVCFGLAFGDQCESVRHVFPPHGRSEIREAALDMALALLSRAVQP